MENPAPSIIVTPIAAPVPAEFVKLTFRTLYMRRTGPGSRQMTVPGRQSDQLGRKLVIDCPVYDGRGSDASLVARLQGVTVHVGYADALFTMVFETDRLKGSTLVINGMVTDGSDEWTIYGGTKVFAMATGVIKRKHLADSRDGNSDELTFEVFCPVLGSSQPPKGQQQGSTVIKMGLWGGSGGSVKDITETPNRLQSFTIRAGDAVDAVEFEYTDSDGQIHTSGRWGGAGGNVQKIYLDDDEYVTEVSGTYGGYGAATTLTSLRLVTSNSRSWGPWGIENGTRFGLTAPNGSSVVGFHVRSGDVVDALGLYLMDTYDTSVH